MWIGAVSPLAGDMVESCCLGKGLGYMTLRVPLGSVMLRFFEHCYFSKNSSKQPKISPRLAV